MALSADGASLYAVAAGDDAIARFDRNTTQRQAHLQGLHHGRDRERGSVARAPATRFGSAASGRRRISGLGIPHRSTLSADGASLYVASRDDDAVARFDRNTTSGKLSYKDCLTGDQGLGGVCRKIHLPPSVGRAPVSTPPARWR